MRRFVTFTVVFLCATIGLAQTKQSNQQAPKDSVLNRIDSLVQITNAWLEQIELDHSLKQRYKLYQTENIYTLLQLDTKTGMIEQVQWSLDSENEGSVTINNDDLNYGYGHGSGSFELYPTKNMYQFILLDKTSGRKWHVQWGMKTKERWIRRIY
ncbi:hypothetical protein [Bacteroides thetaiotaomicron]|jgi:hypothetical protein|uniref:hypothetical protein n=1 Tax=Bacteroides thetaiotaomicron TaxID=818 RepID=UPI000FF6A9AA|nr:hypothetical protein [Bacteroides thetaiotaomicron]MCA6046917.1 hypothetical protein [Bacteroides thetaiotaomicron]RHK34224.1 hypothetical protein DW071_09920 [Bacteroides ovatus]